MIRANFLTRQSALRGRPWRKVKMHHPIHLSQMGPAPVLLADQLSGLQLNYPIVRQSEDIVPLQRTGWTPAPENPRDDLPFQISRTHVGRSLPVYIDYKGHGTKVVTQIRKVSGNVEAFMQDLAKVCDGREVTIKTGRLEVSGNYASRIKAYLTGLGF